MGARCNNCRACDFLEEKKNVSEFDKTDYAKTCLQPCQSSLMLVMHTALFCWTSEG